MALARALINKPRVLLLDEPLGALDLKLRKQMQIELKRIQSEVDITFIHVTHDQEEAMTMADRIAVMNNGTIEQIGPPDELYERPSTTFVAGFLGISNLLTVTADGPGLVRLADGTPARVPEAALKRTAGELRVGVRPEKMRIISAAEPSGESGSNQIRGVIRDVSYVGVSTQYIVATTHGEELTVFAQNTGRAGRAIFEGDDVNVLWDAEHTFVMTDATPPPTLEELQ